VSNQEEGQEQWQQATWDPKNLLHESDHWTSRAVELADQRGLISDGRAAEIIAQVATAKAIAALAAAVLRLAAVSDKPDPTKL
jgi:hypothetical protein